MADKYGLSATGFRRKRLPEIISDICARLEDRLGISIQNGSNSILGQIIGVYAYELADLWEQLENGYNAMYPGTATGKSLSDSAGLAGIALNNGTKSTVTLVCYGTAGTPIAYHAQVKSKLEGGHIWECIEDTASISAGKAYVAMLTVSTAITKGAVYTLTIDGTTVTYTATGEEKSVVTILNGLAKQVTRTDLLTSIDNNVLSIQSKSAGTTFSISASGVEVQTIGTPVLFQCADIGAVDPNTGTITQILTSTVGWSRVTNPFAANVGTAAETDTALRQRWNKSLYTRASASVNAIRAAVLTNVVGVAECLVYENNEDTTDGDGRPPHTVEVVVSGGDDNSIGKTIFAANTGGIKTVGTVSTSVADNIGNTHEVKFNRPEEIKVWFKVVISDNPDETLSTNYKNEIIDALLEKGKTQTIGEDVILQRYFATIFSATSGVGYINLTATTGDTAGTYGSDNISIGARQIAVFDVSRIEVTKK